MLDVLERQQTLTTNQWKIISAAILGDMLDFFDYGLIAFALAFIVGQWKLTYGQSAMILLAAGSSCLCAASSSAPASRGCLPSICHWCRNSCRRASAGGSAG